MGFRIHFSKTDRLRGLGGKFTRADRTWNAMAGPWWRASSWSQRINREG